MLSRREVIAALASLAAMRGPAAAPSAAPAVTISPARRDGRGILIHKVRSPYQPGSTEIQVLLPDSPAADRRYLVVYVLPVEPGRQNRYGDGLAEAARLGLHNFYPAIFVAPTFAQTPWYADHPVRPAIRQETYFLAVVVPFVEKSYPVRPGESSRRLLGFSKSGWGAFSLLLRYPRLFGAAAAWDAPLLLSRPDRYGMAPIFGTLENFQKYEITRLLPQHAAEFRTRQRLFLTGYHGFRDHHWQAHALMDQLDIRHVYREGSPRRHFWHSGWMPEAVQLLLSV
jgi:hypothetical protein